MKSVIHTECKEFACLNISCQRVFYRPEWILTEKIILSGEILAQRKFGAIGAKRKFGAQK